MATYETEFDGYTVDAQPSDWTVRWVSANNNWLVRSKAGTGGGQVLENTGSADGRHLLSWDVIDADADRANAEILVRVRTTNTTAEQFRLVVRGSGAAGAETGYSLIFNASSSLFRLQKYVAGVSTNIGTTLSFTQATNTFYYVKFRANGSDLMGKVWLDDGMTPEPDWQVTATDTAITAAGWVGVSNFESTGTRDFDFIGIGTNGDAAPLSFVPSTGTKTSTVTLEALLLPTADAQFHGAVLEVAVGEVVPGHLHGLVLEVLYSPEAAGAVVQPAPMIIM